MIQRFASVVQEARRIAGSMGTWPFHAAARAEQHAELVGFLRYTSESFEHLLAKARVEAKAASSKAKREAAKARQAELKAWIGQWRRATRWVLSLSPEQARGVAEAVLRQMEGMPYYVQCGHPSLAEADEPPRKPGRQRVRALEQTYKECAACHGFGWV